jgi:2-hydroxy-3-keto-5-methylthiopentenyl-1-phosphate phosphatase
MKKVALITDFDGTISRRDIGHHFFGAFIPDRARWLGLLEQWRLGLISSRECLEHEIALVRADQEDLDTFLDNEGIDPYFKDFIDFCERRGASILVTSDGLDYYIDRLLIRFGLGYLEFNANHLVLSDGAFGGIEFPYFNTMECTRCGNCKRFHLEKLRREGLFTVYVGNGFSDRCPAEHADVVLAKGELLEHCRAQKIEHIPFENFRDVERELTDRFIIHSGNISL